MNFRDKIEEKIFEWGLAALGCVLAALGCLLGYLIRCKSNVDNLKTQVEELRGARGRLQHDVDTAIRNLMKIEDDVKRRLTESDDIVAVAEKILEDDNKRWYINMMFRYQVSKRAEKAASEAKNLKDEISKINSVGYRESTQVVETVTSNRGYEVFESRKPTITGVLEALKDPNITRIGIHGMGGVGKTMLVKEVLKQAEKDKLFDKYVFLVVSNDPDLKRIQREMAEQLDLKLEVESELVRRDQLRKRLKQENRVLIILEDIWKYLDLEALGIFFGDDQKGCKLLLTSRFQNILRDFMDTQMQFPVGVLSDNEARSLFEKIVGDLAKTSEIKPAMLQIVEECAGLPIAITTVANVLKNRKNIDAWECALNQLKISRPTEIVGINEKVYTSIKFSYKFLPDEEKSLLLLCSLHAEDYNMKVEDLLKYAVGWDLLKSDHKIKHARSKVHKLVEGLKASCLLLDGDDNGTVKMHDVIRDVVIYIAAEEKHMFTIRTAIELQNLSKREDAVAISLPYINDDLELPNQFECSKLELLLLFDQEIDFRIPDSFFEGLKDLKVLKLSESWSGVLPSSLSSLENLHTLCLDGYEVQNAIIIGELKNLKALSLSLSNTERLPKEMGQLTHLQLLDLRKCSELKFIPPNVLSNLKRLEELYLPDDVEWEVEAQSTERINAKVSELEHLSHLTKLHIGIQNPKILPKAKVFERLESYRIVIGSGDLFGYGTLETSRILKLNISFQLDDGYKVLLRTCQSLFLGKMKGVQNIFYELDSNGFPSLKHLTVQHNDEIQYIVKSMGVIDSVFPSLESITLLNVNKLERICYTRLPMKTFCNLRVVTVSKCCKLEFVFYSFMVGCFSHLQEMNIEDCEIMSAIVAIEREEEIAVNSDDNIMFANLHSLKLKNLFKLKGVLSIVDSLVLFNGKVVFPNLEKMNIYGVDSMKMIWPNQRISDSFGKLETMNVSCCTNLTNIVPPNMLRTLQNLKELKISHCGSIEEVFEIEGTNNVEETHDIAVTELRSLELRNLEKMKHVWSMDPQGIIIFGKLRTVRIFGCSSLKSVFPMSVAKALTQLEELSIEDCAVEEIVAKEVIETTIDPFVLQQLSTLTLQNLLELKSFYPGKHIIELSSLKYLNIRLCDKLKIFGSNELSVPETKVRFPNLRRMSIHGKDHLKMIWPKELVTNSFSKLKTLIVEWCEDSNIFPPHMLSGLQNLEELQIFNCDSTEKVYVSQGVNVKEISFQMRYLCLYNLPRLLHVWRLDPEVIFTFKNLHEVRVSNCESLRSLFPVSVAKHLSQLGLLEICDCGLEEIVGMEEGLKTRATFIFPQLRSLILKRLPQLKNFYGGEYKSQWPLLKDLNISSCDKLKSFGSDALDFPKTSGPWNQNKNHLFPVFFLEKDTFPNLEQLKLDWKETMNNRTQCRFPAQFFSKLKVIKLSGAPFEELCGLTSEEQHAGTLEEQYAWTLERLTVLKLSKMPNLTHLWKENSLLRMALQKLQKLEVSECDGLVNLVPTSMCFQNLQKLVVSKCHGLDCLVTPWTVKSLVRLTKMVIYECKIMKEIVANEGSEAGGDIIFKDLKSLELCYLQSLTSFHSGNCTIKFPSLKELITIECPKFSTSSIPNWNELKQAEKDEPALGNHIAQTKELWEGDLISTIKRFWEDNFDMHEQQKFAEKAPFIPSVSAEKVYIPEAMEDNNFDDVEDIVSQDNTSFPEDFSDRIPSSVNEMSAAHGTSLEETISLASLPLVMASLVAEKTSVEDNISSCQLDDELPKIIVEEDTREDGPVMKENVNVCPAADQPVITSNIQQGASTSLLRLAAPTVIQESLDAFLARFDEDGTNEHTVSHFWIFSGANADWCRFSVPSDSIPLLERLLAKHEDFITRFKLGAGIGNFLLRLLAAIVMDMHNTRLDSLSERKLVEWKNAVKELICAGLPVEFLLTYLRYIGKIWFTRGLKAQLASFDGRIAEVGAKLSALKSEREQLRAIAHETITHNELVTHELF